MPDAPRPAGRLHSLLIPGRASARYAGLALLGALLAARPVHAAPGTHTGLPGGAARRELVAHGRALGVANAGRLPLGRLQRRITARELQRARRLDRRSSPALVRALMARFGRAQRMRAARMRALFGFSQLIDAKVPFSQELVARLERAADPAQVEALVARGPGPEGWGRLDTPTQLVAALVHHQLHGEGASLQLSVSPELDREHLAPLLEDPALRIRQAVGGAAAFGANIAASFDEIDPVFHSGGETSPAQAARYEPRVKLVTRRSGAAGVAAAKAGHPDARTKVNYIVEAEPDVGFEYHGASGAPRAARTPGVAGRVILSTSGGYRPAFDPKLRPRELAKLARSVDVFVAVGLHALTGYDAARFGREAGRLRAQLRQMRRANPRLYVHYQYVRAKVPGNEWRLFAAMRGQLDSLSLNTVELDALADNLEGHTLDPARGPVRLPPRGRADARDAQEDPVRAYALGRAVLDALGLERLHLHGYNADMVLVRDGDAARMDREGLGVLKGRQLGVNKVVNASGEVRTARDRWGVLPTVAPEGVAALWRFADHLGERHGLSAEERKAVVRDGYFVPPGDRVAVAITPTRHAHDRAGGLVSLGDTLDITALLHSVRPAR